MKRTIAIIGEGITEKFYIESLKGLTPFTVLPQALGRKASSLKKLDDEIKNSIQKGFDEVYCLIDMDGKREGTSKIAYNKLKTKYHNKIHGKKKESIQCKVEFIETERCTELWFLYHFTNTAITREFCNYKELEAELQRYRPHYEKTEKYFRSVSSLHIEMTNKREPHGSLEKALKNARNSVATRDCDSRPHTYCEMFRLFEALGLDH